MRTAFSVSDCALVAEAAVVSIGSGAGESDTVAVSVVPAGLPLRSEGGVEQAASAARASRAGEKRRISIARLYAARPRGVCAGLQAGQPVAADQHQDKRRAQAQ